jgi:hypothetical protein
VVAVVLPVEVLVEAVVASVLEVVVYVFMKAHIMNFLLFFS